MAIRIFPMVTARLQDQRQGSCGRRAPPNFPYSSLMKMTRLTFAISLLLLATAQAAPPPPPGEPRPGEILLQVDATDLDHRLFQVRQQLPVSPGPLQLHYPKWLPGNHAPRGPIEALTGLRIQADGQDLAWARDPLDVYAFTLEVPAGVQALDISFQYASPLLPEQGRTVMTPDMLGLQWNAVLLYPAGHDTRQLRYAASLRLPVGWQYGSALRERARDGDTLQFQPVSLETLVDSPVFAGRHYRRVDLSPDPGHPVTLHLVADRAADLVPSDEQLAAHRKLIREAQLLFASRPYAHYDFMLALSEQFSGIGLEHHQSSENALPADYFRDWTKGAPGRSLLPHEYVHSWNGKYRRPADLWTPNYQQPMQNTGLWVYEGQTQFWGAVLAARSGLWTQEYTRDFLATLAASFERGRAGRDWRPLQDTTHQPIITPRRPLSFPSWQRGEDYYNEGLLLWLEVDARLRELSGGRRSMDDFARLFFGGVAGAAAVNLYDFDEVVATLGRVQPGDWARLLRERLDSVGAEPPLQGLERAGWKLVYRDTPNAHTSAVAGRRKLDDQLYSLGILIDKDGVLDDVLWGSPAFSAGLAKGMKLIAVDSIAYDPDQLRQALLDARNQKRPLALLVRSQDRFRSVQIDYRDGPRFPALERIEATPDRLELLLKPRS